MLMNYSQSFGIPDLKLNGDDKYLNDKSSQATSGINI